MTDDIATISAAADKIEAALVRQKFCPYCRQRKPVTEYSPSPRRHDGLNSYCRPCHAESMRAYRSTEHGRIAAKAADKRVRDRKRAAASRTP